MFDVYDSIVKFIEDNQKISYCKCNNEGISLLGQYNAWCKLNDLNILNYMNDKVSKEKFLCEIIYGVQGDALTRILSEEDLNMQKSQIEFLYSDLNIGEKVEKYKDECYIEEENVKKQLEKLNSMDIFKTHMNMSISKDIRVMYHISSVENSIKMFYFMDSGVLLSINADYDLDIKEKLSFDNVLLMFKALADESRLKIVMQLAKSDMTVTQLAESVGLTLSTVMHHIKKLVECSIVQMNIVNKSTRGQYFSLNKEYINKYMKGVQNEIQ